MHIRFSDYLYIYGDLEDLHIRRQSYGYRIKGRMFKSLDGVYVLCSTLTKLTLPDKNDLLTEQSNTAQRRLQLRPGFRAWKAFESRCLSDSDERVAIRMGSIFKSRSEQLDNVTSSERITGNLSKKIIDWKTASIESLWKLSDASRQR